MQHKAKADVTPVRQRSQYSCMSTSLMLSMQALGRKELDEDTVNRVVGAAPMQGAAWEDIIAAAQHFGFRTVLMTPCTVPQLKEWTDRGIPVMIAWNPEGRDWSHASVVFDVDDDWNIHVADPNMPDPEKTVRVVSKDDFYHMWFEKLSAYLVRRPACAIMPEITPDGRQVMAAIRPRIRIQPHIWDKLFKEHREKRWYTEEMKGQHQLNTMEYWLKEDERGFKHQRLRGTKRIGFDSNDPNPLCHVETPINNDLCPKNKGKDTIRVTSALKLAYRWINRRK